MCQDSIMKRILTPLVLAFALTLTACGGTTATPTVATDDKPAEETQTIPNLAGKWKQSNSASEDSYQHATITDDTITVEWVSDGGATTSTYWIGTFKAPTDATAPYVWSSKRDVKATESALLASNDDTKEFTYDGETISYKVTALGTTTKVELKK